MSDRSTEMKFGSIPPEVNCKYCKQKEVYSVNLSFKEVAEKVDEFEKRHFFCRRST